MTATMPRCDLCTPLGHGHHHAAGEAALYVEGRREWMCAHCRREAGVTVPGVYRPGQDGYIAPGSPEHAAAISPSKVAAILGISRWESSYRLWHRMRGLVDPEPPSDAFDVGHDLESYAAARWKRKNPGWRLSAGEVQFVIDPERFGFPAIATLDRRGNRGRAQRCVEMKRALTMSDLEQWGDDLSGDLPADYAAQVTAQMVFSGLTKYSGQVCAIGPYYQDRVYDVEYDSGVADWIISECKSFYDSLAGDEPPNLDDSVPTYECIRAMHPDIDGTTVEVDLDLAVQLLDWNRDYKGAETRVRGFKSQILEAMGDARYAECNGIRVADRRPHAKGGVALSLAMKNVDELFNLKHGTRETA